MPDPVDVLDPHPPPTVGRIVLVSLKRDTGDAPPTAAIITRVFSDGQDPYPQLNLCVFPADGHMPFGVTFVKHESYARDERVCWRWPPRA